ncbi:MAG: hypothetical protein SH820_17550 [Xanthomonadales bacterium]|nr:hypothetical protein [Xanthomonadales bacterium]
MQNFINLRKLIAVGMLWLLLWSVAAQGAGGPIEQDEQFLRRAGGFATFSEMVRLGVKKLALSASMSPEDMDSFMAEAQRIANENNLQIYRETDFLVTDLFPAKGTEGKHVILIYEGEVLEQYLALKEIKAALIETNRYSGRSRSEVARVFGHMLSYPDAVIDKKLMESGSEQTP